MESFFKQKIFKVDSDSDSDFSLDLDDLEDIEDSNDEDFIPELLLDDQDMDVGGSDSDIDTNEAMEIDHPELIDTSSSLFQKEVWQFRLLPYYQELQQDADFYFSHIKLVWHTLFCTGMLDLGSSTGFVSWTDSFNYTPVDSPNWIT
uniref:Uncharacterized protein n=1 Tax=Ditylenchus dipsaci TaxID=166011 RepID=A0A915D7C0_9BILA